MDILIRSYLPQDYSVIKTLYQDSSLFGGQFDESRDSQARLQKRIEADPNSILVAEIRGKIVGTVSLIEDARIAWLFRFCVIENNHEVAQKLLECAEKSLKEKGHNQILVYAPVDNTALSSRYNSLGFTKGNDYTCFWKNIKLVKLNEA